MKVGWLRSKRFWLFVAIGAALALGLSVLPWQTWLMGVKNWLVTLGPWAMPAFVLVYVLTTVLGLPNILLVLGAGTLFGLAGGIIAASIADSLGAVVCFGLGRTIARKRIKQWMQRHPNFAQLDHALGKKGWKILLLTRLSPLVPSNVLNYGFSCTKVNFWQYWFFSWLGMLPVIALYVYLGSFGAAMLRGGNTPGNVALQAAGLIFTLCAALYTTRLAKKTLATPPCQPLEAQELQQLASKEMRSKE